MINNDGAIITECKVDGKLCKQAYKKNFLLIAALIVISVACLILEILYIRLHSIAYDDIFMLVCFCALFVLGAVLLVISLIAVKHIGSSQKSCECEIYSDYMLVSLYEKGEKQAEEKVDYKNLLKSKETKDYFLAYANKTSFYPIPKERLTPQEQNAIRKLLRLRILQGCGMAEIAKYKGALTETTAGTDSVQENEVKGE